MVAIASTMDPKAQEMLRAESRHMKAKFKVGDELRLKADQVFTRSFTLCGYNKDGSVRDIDKQPTRAGSIATVSESHEAAVANAEASVHLDFGDFQMHLSEAELLHLFDPL
jgi:hypothetical protein